MLQLRTLEKLKSLKRYTVEDFGKVEVTQEVSKNGLQHGSESSTLVHVEEETKDDLDAGVDDVEHGKESHDQGEQANVRKVAQVPVPSTQYLSLKYVKIT